MRYRTDYALLFFLILWIACLNKTFSQVTDFYDRPSSDTLTREGISIHGSALIYFKNNEYIKQAYPGFTALGANTEADITYRRGRHVLTAGLLYQFVFGAPMRHRVMPVLSYRYGLTKDLRVVMGVLEGPAEHRLLQEVQGIDTYFEDPLEYGIQFRYTPQWLDADVWINWRENIMTGDSAQEKFTQGSRLTFHIWDRDDWKLDVNTSLLFYHYGGQVDISDAPVVTQMNYSAGVALSKQIHNWEYRLAYNYLAFKNDEDFTLIPWDRGSGHSISATADNRKFYFELAYRTFDRYYSPFGDQVFGVFNTFTRELFGSRKEIVSATGQLRLAADRNFGLNIGAEFYYNLPTGQLDYNYSLVGRVKF